MSVESLPKFTGPAARLWAKLPREMRKLYISNVWCKNCGSRVAITDFTGTVRDGNLLLVGLCIECHGDVATVIEMP